MNYEDLTIKEAREIAKLFSSVNSEKTSETFIKKGKAYLIRTVTMINVGVVKEINSQEFLLEKAAWVADTGRFSESLEKVEFNEVEPYINDVVINRGGIIDFTEINLKAQLKLK